MFQTRVEIPVSEFKISFEDNIMSLGSCFAENIGKKMKDVCFEADINPFGVLFNPVSICNSLEILLHDKIFTKEDIFEYKSLWQSFSHSSLFSDSTAEGCLSKINDRLNDARTFLGKANILLITFGTAWVFEDKKSGRVVSNCHKLPAGEFIRRRLTVEEIVADYTLLINKLQSVLPALTIIFSVSPVRHWKDGAHDNNISKSTLLLAIDELQTKLQKVHYFPAYEIQMDELRDYRFYAPDMLHPSDVAVDYIWNRFSETYFSRQTEALKKRLEQLKSDLTHRPMHPDSIEYVKFLDKTEKRREDLIHEFPFLLNRI
ncbi:MAG: GSCFA domain-containing protein [Paludibacter sp.]|nr:GSCFA domain-containing protein [Paludibacter sp.]